MNRQVQCAEQQSEHGQELVWDCWENSWIWEGKTQLAKVIDTERCENIWVRKQMLYKSFKPFSYWKGLPSLKRELSVSELKCHSSDIWRKQTWMRLCNDSKILRLRSAGSVCRNWTFKSSLSPLKMLCISHCSHQYQQKLCWVPKYFPFFSQKVGFFVQMLRYI